MSIIIETREHIETYPDADRWVIDDEGRLHVPAPGGGNLASFNTGIWLSANRNTDDKAQ